MFRNLIRSNLLLAAIILLAAFFRLFRLDSLPPGFQFDQAYYVFDVIRLLQGEFHIFFAVPGGTEPLYPYLAMPAVAVFGDQAFGLRLTGAIIGILTIPAMYWFAKTFFHSSRLGLLSAFLASTSLWHVFFNRYGERVSLLVLLALLIFQFFWRAISTLRRRDFGLTGVFVALALYTYPGSRVLPIALIVLTGYVMLVDRKNALAYLQGLITTGVVALIIFAPLGIYYLQHPDQFASHSVEVSIFVPHGDVPADVGAALAYNVLRIAGMFFIAGDGGVLRNTLPGRPVFDPLLGTLFVAGVIVWLAALFLPRGDAINRRRAVFIGVWLGAILSISLITDDAPNFVRTLPAMPAVMVLAAWGVSNLWERLRSPWLRKIGTSALVLVLLFSAVSSYRDYFIAFAEDPATYYTFDTDKVEIADWINRHASTHQIFLAPLLQENGTISLLTRLASLKSFDSRDTIVLPSNVAGKDAIFVFPWEQERRVQTMATRLGLLGERQDLFGTNGGKLILLYRVPAQNLPHLESPISILARGGDFIQPQKIAREKFGDAIELLGYSVNAADAAKRNLEVTLFIHALASMTEEYTFSLKVWDAKDRVWGQEDKWAGNNSYATTAWTPGDVIVEKFYPGLNACAPAGDYWITVEVYDPKTLQALGEPASLGSWRADASPSNRLEDLEPARTLAQSLSPQLRLIGYSLSSDVLKPGGHFSLALFWRGVGNGSAEKINVHLQSTSLIETIVQIPVEGRGLCSHFDFQAPPNLPVGNSSIWVNEFKLADVMIAK